MENAFKTHGKHYITASRHSGRLCSSTLFFEPDKMSWAVEFRGCPNKLARIDGIFEKHSRHHITNTQEWKQACKQKCAALNKAESDYQDVVKLGSREIRNTRADLNATRRYLEKAFGELNRVEGQMSNGLCSVFMQNLNALSDVPGGHTPSLNLRWSLAPTKAMHIISEEATNALAQIVLDPRAQPRCRSSLLICTAPAETNLSYKMEPVIRTVTSIHNDHCCARYLIVENFQDAVRIYPSPSPGSHRTPGE